MSFPSKLASDSTWNSHKYFRLGAEPAASGFTVRNRRGATYIKYRRPTTAAGTPTQERSNMPIGFMPTSSPAAIASAVMPATIRLTAPPMSVVFPPRMDAKLIPMSKLGATSPACRRRSRATGIIIATMGVLLMKALPIATGARILRLAAVSFLGLPIRRCDSNEMAPVEYIPAATGNNAATVSTPGLLKPFKSPFAGASCRVIATVVAPRNTTQIGSLSHTISANIVTSTINVSEACRGMRAGSDQIGAQQIGRDGSGPSQFHGVLVIVVQMMARPNGA